MYLTSEDSVYHIPTYTEAQQKIKYDIQCTLLQKIQVIFLHTLKFNRRLNMIYNVPYFRRFRSYSYLYWSSTEDQIWYTMYLTSEDSGHIPTYTEAQQKIKYDIQCTLLQKIQVIFLLILKLNRRSNMIYNVPYFRRFRSYSYLTEAQQKIKYDIQCTWLEDSGHIPTYTEAQQKIKYEYDLTSEDSDHISTYTSEDSDIQCTWLKKIQVIFLLILKLNRRSNMIYNVPDFRRFRSYSYLYWSSTEDQIWYTMYLTSEDSGHIPTYTEAQQKIKYDIQCTLLQKIQVIFLLILKLNRRSNMIYNVPDFRRFRSYSYLYWSSTEDQIWYTLYLTSEDSGHISTYTEAQQNDIQCTWLQKIQVIFLLILKLNRRSNMIYNVPDFRRFRSYSYLYWSSTEDQIWYTMYLTSEDSGHIPTYTEVQQKIKYDIQCTLLQKIQVIFLLILKLNRRSNMNMYLTSEDSGHIPTYTEAQQKIKYDIQCTLLQKIQVIFLLILKLNRRSNMIYNVPDFRRFRSYSYLYWSSTEDQIWYTLYLTSEDSGHIPTYTEAQQKIKYDIQCTWLQKIQVIFLLILKLNRRSNMIYNVPDFRRFRSYSYLYWSSTEDQIWYTMYLTSEDSGHIPTYTEAILPPDKLNNKNELSYLCMNYILLLNPRFCLQSFKSAYEKLKQGDMLHSC